MPRPSWIAAVAVDALSGCPDLTDDARDDYAVDHDRVVHSGSFRRLQVKTQILNLGESDFYRTRLTHTLKVARIASNVAR